MISSEYCNPRNSIDNRRNIFQKRRLEMLKFIRDSYERKLSSINASISTLENQIERDSKIENQD